MNKTDFFNILLEEDKNLVSKLYDKYVLALKSGKCIFSNEFHTPNIWSKLMDCSAKLDVVISTDGAFEDSDRRMIAFHAYDKESYPFRVIRIRNKSKFSRLDHKDYLGALMALGIKREKVGDLITGDDYCYTVVCEDILDFIKGNLLQIGKSPCEINDITNNEEIPKPNLAKDTIIATSYRIDCIVSSFTGMSRSKSIDYISSGKVLLNYNVVTEKDKVVSESSIVTIRGFGKFKVLGYIGNSKSGRLKINIAKYL